jgi:putative addiction module component (TIGR02574 family)
VHTKLTVLTEDLKLPPIERVELIDELFLSFDATERSSIDQLWAAEAESRIDAHERGEFTAIPADSVFARLNQ